MLRRFMRCIVLGGFAGLATGCAKDDGAVATTSGSMSGGTASGGTASGGTGSTGPLLDTGVLDASLEGHSCDSACCTDDVRFFVEDGRTTFTLTLELGGSTNDTTLRCPDGPHDADPSWTVTCEGAAVRVDSDGTDLGGDNNGVRLEGGPRQTWGAELEFADCDCNCLPREGSVVVLLDPTGSTSSGDGSSTGDTGSTTAGASTSSGSSG